MPHIIVKPWPGKSERQKNWLAEQITNDVMSTLGYGEESASITFEEISPNEWAEKVYQPYIVGNTKMLYKKPGYTV